MESAAGQAASLRARVAERHPAPALSVRPARARRVVEGDEETGDAERLTVAAAAS
jgi:hypothetical protein